MPNGEVKLIVDLNPKAASHWHIIAHEDTIKSLQYLRTSNSMADTSVAILCCEIEGYRKEKCVAPREIDASRNLKFYISSTFWKVNKVLPNNAIYMYTVLPAYIFTWVLLVHHFLFMVCGLKFEINIKHTLAPKAKC